MALLVLYHCKREFPPRWSLRDNIYAFPGAYYVNVAFRRLPAYLLQPGAVQAVLFHHSLLIERMFPEYFRRLLRRLEPLSELPARRALMVQDEHLLIDVILELIHTWRVNEVFSVASPSLWPRLYPDLPPEVRLHFLLTGYLEMARLPRVRAWIGHQPRNIDVGYRARPPSLEQGSHGQLKARIAYETQHFTRALGLRSDISVQPEDTLLGAAWYQFLARCRYVVGVEGGASILDADGSLRQAVLAGQGLPPDHKDDLAYFALSPRHLEACLTRTGQILVEGDYGGVLRPWEHYLPVKRDLSDLPQVLQRVSDEPLRQQMTERAYREVVASETYSNERLCERVYESLQLSPTTPTPLLKWDRAMDHLSWAALALYDWGVEPARRGLRAGLGGLLGEQRAQALVARLRGQR